MPDQFDDKSQGLQPGETSKPQQQTQLAGADQNCLSAESLTGPSVLEPDQRLLLLTRFLDAYNPAFAQAAQFSLNLLEGETRLQESQDKPLDPLQLLANPDAMADFASEVMTDLGSASVKPDSLKDTSAPIDRAIEEVLNRRLLDASDNIEAAFKSTLAGIQESEAYQKLLAEYLRPTGADISALATQVFDVQKIDEKVVFAIPLSAASVTALIDGGARSLTELGQARKEENGDQNMAMAFGEFTGDGTIVPIRGVNLCETVDPPYCYLKVDLDRLNTPVFSGVLMHSKGAHQRLQMGDDSAVIFSRQVPPDCLTLWVMEPDAVFTTEDQFGSGADGTPGEMKERQLQLIAALLAVGIPYQMCIDR